MKKHQKVLHKNYKVETISTLHEKYFTSRVYIAGKSKEKRKKIALHKQKSENFVSTKSETRRNEYKAYTTQHSTQIRCNKFEMKIRQQYSSTKISFKCIFAFELLPIQIKIPA